MAGVTVSAITSGRITTRTGHYRYWPIIGLGAATVGIFLLGRIHAGIGRGYVSVAMLILGLGLGMTMPIITLAVQNSVEWRDLGVASSAVTFIRSLGGAIGLAVYGAVFAGRLQGKIPSSLAKVIESPSQIKALPEPTRTHVVTALANAVRSVFVAALPVMILSWILSLFLKELPLRETSGLDASRVTDAAPSPSLH
jgi:MFS family permease